MFIAPEFKFHLLYSKLNQQPEELKFSVLMNQLKYNGELITPFKTYEHLLFNGALVNTGQQNFRTSGNIFKNMHSHKFDGDVTMVQNVPTQIDLNISQLDSDETKLSFSVTSDKMTKKIKGKVSNQDSFLSFESEFYIHQLYDWAYNIRVQSSKPELEELKLSTSLSPLSKSQFESSFEMISPWKSYMIDKINVSSFLTMNEKDGNFKLEYKTSESSGNAGMNWKWLRKLMEQNYNFKIFAENGENKTIFNTEFLYTNSSKNPTEFLIQADYSPDWSILTKGKLDVRNTKNMNMVYELQLPEPIKNTHKFTASYSGKEFPPKIIENSHGDLKIKYENSNVEGKIDLKGAIETFSNYNKKMKIQWKQENTTNEVDSEFHIKTVNEKSNCSWEVTTPLFENEKSLDLKLNYYAQDLFKIIHLKAYAPESHRISEGDIAFSDFSNLKGYVNFSLPMTNLSWFDINFDFDSQNDENSKFLKASWPDSSAFLDSKSFFTTQDSHKEWKGTIRTEIPLYSNHSIQIIYGLEVSSIFNYLVRKLLKFSLETSGQTVDHYGRCFDRVQFKNHSQQSLH